MSKLNVKVRSLSWKYKIVIKIWLLDKISRFDCLFVEQVTKYIWGKYFVQEMNWTGEKQKHLMPGRDWLGLSFCFQLETWAQLQPNFTIICLDIYANTCVFNMFSSYFHYLMTILFELIQKQCRKSEDRNNMYFGGKQEILTITWNALLGWFCSSWVAHWSSIFICNFPFGSRSTQISWRGCSALLMRSDRGNLQFAIKSSGGTVASWKTVNPISSADLSRSVENVSFQSGSRVFDLVLVLSTNTSSTSIATYGSRSGFLPSFSKLRRVMKFVCCNSFAAHIVT